MSLSACASSPPPASSPDASVLSQTSSLASDHNPDQQSLTGNTDRNPDQQSLTGNTDRNPDQQSLTGNTDRNPDQQSLTGNTANVILFIKKVKASSYIAQYPVLRTVQSALHFTSLTDLFTQTPPWLLWEVSSIHHCL